MTEAEVGDDRPGARADAGAPPSPATTGGGRPVLHVERATLADGRAVARYRHQDGIAR